MSSVTWGGRPCVEPRSALDACRSADPPLPADWWGLPNSWANPLGCRSGTGWVLLLRRDLDALGLAQARDLVFSLDASEIAGIQSPTRTVTHRSLHAVAARCITPGLRGDPLSCYLVELADRRRLYRPIPIDRAYNVPLYPGGSAYRSATKNAGSAWTWAQAAQDVWESVGVSRLGAFPGLPFTPHGAPQGLAYHGRYALDALEDLLDRLGCALKLDTQSDTFSIVRLGAADAAADAALAAWDHLRALDDDPLEPTLGRYPQYARVLFPKLRPHADLTGSSPWYAVDVADPSGTPAGVESGTYALIEDRSLQAVYAADGTLQNAAALAARAAELAADHFRELRQDRLRRVYCLPLDGVGLRPGSRLRLARHGDRGRGLVTEALSRPGLGIDGHLDERSAFDPAGDGGSWARGGMNGPGRGGAEDPVRQLYLPWWQQGRPSIDARISGAAVDGKYPWVEVHWDSDAQDWADLPGGASGTTAARYARDLNGNDALPDCTRVKLTLAPDGTHYTFDHCCEGSPCPAATCVVWYTGYQYLATLAEGVEAGAALDPGAALGLIGPHPGGAHLHFSLGDGNPLLTPSSDPGLSSFVGQTLPVAGWLGLEQVNTRTPGLQGPYQHAYTAAEVAVIRERTSLPVDDSLAWVDVLGSALHAGYEWHACDLNTLPWDTPLHTDDEVGQGVISAASGDDVVTTVEHVQDMGESGWLVVLRHAVNCDEEGSGSGSGEDGVETECCPDDALPLTLCATFGGVLADLGSVDLAWDAEVGAWINLSVPGCGGGLVLAFDCPEGGPFRLRGTGAAEFSVEGEATTCDPFLWEAEFSSFGGCAGEASVSIEPGPCAGSGSGSGSGDDYTWEEPDGEDAPPSPLTVDLVTQVCPEFTDLQVDLADAEDVSGVLQPEHGGTGTVTANRLLGRYSGTDGAVEQITPGGDFTLSGGELNLTDKVAPDTYAKVTVDAKGRVTSGASLSPGDLPAHEHSASDITSGVLDETRGGTGHTTYTYGEMLFCTGPDTLSKLTPNTTTARKFLRQYGNGTNAQSTQWDTLAGDDITSGAVGPAFGGTGITSYTKGDILYSDAADSLAALPGNPLGAKKYLVSDGNGTIANAPRWEGVDAGSITAGTLAVARGGTGLASYAVGDILYASATTTLAKLAGNATTAKKYLRQYGGGAVVTTTEWAAPPTATSDGVTLSSNYTISAANGTWVNVTGVSFTITEPGKYLVIAQVRGYGQFTAGSLGRILVRLHDGTNAISTEALVVFLGTASVQTEGTAVLVAEVTITGSTTVQLQAVRESATTWNNSGIGSAASSRVGETHMRYWRMSDG